MKKYEELLELTEAQRDIKETADVAVAVAQDKVCEEVVNVVPKENVENEEKQFDKEELIRELKKFRLEMSRAEGLKPYYIFNDAQMNDLIDKKPSTKEQLLIVQGFGPVKIEKYGEFILKILNKF